MEDVVPEEKNRSQPRKTGIQKPRSPKKPGQDEWLRHEPRPHHSLKMLDDLWIHQNTPRLSSWGLIERSEVACAQQSRDLTKENNRDYKLMCNFAYQSRISSTCQLECFVPHLKFKIERNEVQKPHPSLLVEPRVPSRLYNNFGKLSLGWNAGEK